MLHIITDSIHNSTELKTLFYKGRVLLVGKAQTIDEGSYFTTLAGLSGNKFKVDGKFFSFNNLIKRYDVIEWR